MELNDKQLRGVELVGNAIKKKFPYIKDVKLGEDYSNPKFGSVLFLDVYMDYKELANKYHLTVPPYFTQIKSHSLSPYFESDTMTDEELFQFFHDLRNEIKNTMNNLYRQLPDEFVKRRKVFDWSDTEYPIDLSPFDYHDTNPPATWSEYMAYENKK